MSIIITGLEMPTGSLPIRLELWPDGQVCALEQGEYWSVAKAVPVPPHGRLIDADAIRADIDEKRPGRSYEDAWALTIIDAAPTIIPAEEGNK